MSVGAARGVVPVFRRCARDPVPRAHLVLRRAARRGPPRQPPRRFILALERHRPVQAPRQVHHRLCVPLPCLAMRMTSLYLTHAGLRGVAVFLNKFDLLEKKLASGTKVNKYLPSFADRENNAPTLARCEFCSSSRLSSGSTQSLTYRCSCSRRPPQEVPRSASRILTAYRKAVLRLRHDSYREYPVVLGAYRVLMMSLRAGYQRHGLDAHLR